MRLFLLSLIVLILVLEMSCSSDNVNPANTLSEDSVILSHLDTLNVNYQVDGSGIYYYPLELNPTGKTQDDGNVLSIYYSLSVLEGQNLIIYDSADGDPLRMKQGVNAIYPIGVDLSLSYMKQGESWVFIIPSKLAYPGYSSSLIPENAILIFQAQLDSIHDENYVQFNDTKLIKFYSDSVKLADTVSNPLNQPVFLNSGVTYKRLRSGSSQSIKPNSGDTVTITYQGYLPFMKEEAFDLRHASSANPFTYLHNTNQVVSGLDFGIAEMSVGEKSLLIIPSLLGFKESVAVLPDYIAEDIVDLNIIPSYATKVDPYEVIIFEVELLEIN